MTTQLLKFVASSVTLVALTLTSGPAGAASPCGDVDTNLSAGRQQEYKHLVTRAVTAKVNPSAVKIFNFMENGSWSAVYVSTPVADDGVFFFQDVNGKKQFKDVWGGWADPSDRPELIKWARDLGAPQKLAACFADVVIRG